MKNKKIPGITAFFLICIMILSMFTGCMEEEQKSTSETKKIHTEIPMDKPSILPDWNDGEYHGYHATIQKLEYLNSKYLDLVDIFSIGKSVQKREIYCIKITNEKNNKEKLSCLIDGCIHGNEWEAGEACLYLSEYLLINFDDNKTINNILNTSEIYIVPLLNPDGRQENTRWNYDKIDLNRNFDVDFGRLRGSSIRLGKILKFIKIPYFYIPFYGEIYNCGRKPFSEPESQAMRDLMKTLEKDDFSFYVNCHTAMHNIITPWGVFKPPFEMKDCEKDLFDYVKKWVDSNTEYEGDPISYYACGAVTDWCFKEFRIPSFTFEILTIDYEPWIHHGKHDNLVHWMKTTIPVFMYFLVNIENLHNWNIPDIQPVLPDGIPPDPLK